jgi:hypothetical protein
VDSNVTPGRTSSSDIMAAVCPNGECTERPQRQQLTPPPPQSVCHVFKAEISINHVFKIVAGRVRRQLVAANGTGVVDAQPRNNAIRMIEMHARHLSHFPANLKLLLAHGATWVVTQMHLRQFHPRQLFNDRSRRRPYPELILRRHPFYKIIQHVINQGIAYTLGRGNGCRRTRRPGKSERNPGLSTRPIFSFGYPIEWVEQASQGVQQLGG